MITIVIRRTSKPQQLGFGTHCGMHTKSINAWLVPWKTVNCTHSALFVLCAAKKYRARVE